MSNIRFSWSWVLVIGVLVVLSNSARLPWPVTALVVGPVAASAALQYGIDPAAAGVAVAIACSAAFLTPIAHPVNVLMMGPGGYTFNDFPRVGAGLTLVCFLTLLACMRLFWGIG